MIPQRQAAIGAPQDLDDEEKDVLKIAFELNLPMLMQRRNPKAQRSTSRARYEKHKGGKASFGTTAEASARSRPRMPLWRTWWTRMSTVTSTCPLRLMWMRLVS